MNRADVINIVMTMKSRSLKNYVIPGLTSSLLENGKVRLFENERKHLEYITPHSHRFDFVCVVLQGIVWNTVWKPCHELEGDLFQVSELEYKGEVGEHVVRHDCEGFFNPSQSTYKAGDSYAMNYEDIHSIQFERGTKVLFFEGPEQTQYSRIIQPKVDGQIIPTCKTEKWMFKS